MHAYILFFLLITVSGQHSGTAGDCQCGIENTRSRIINGKSVKPYTHPWVLYVEGRDGSNGISCTGSLIAPNFVLTAAHCVPVDENPNGFFVSSYQGCQRFNHRSDRRNRRAVYRIIRHPGYLEVKGGDDLAILQLESAFPDLMPICLPQMEYTYDNLFVSGWGLQNRGLRKERADCLNEVALDTVNVWYCRLLFQFWGSKVLCAGGQTGVCDGDSGGPLMSRAKGLVVQAGITSFTREDCGIATKSPAGFEKVGVHVQWIRDNSRGACFK